MKSIKSEKHKVGLSSSFVLRSRCKICGGPPIFYYDFYHKIYTKSIIYSNSFAFSFKDNYWTFYIPEFKLSEISLILKRKYSPRFHKNNKIKDNVESINEFISCGCCLTSWSIIKNFNSEKPEIKNRKSDKNYPMYF